MTIVELEKNDRMQVSLVDSNSQLAKMLDNDLMSEIQNSEKLREFYKKLIKTNAQIRSLKKNNEIYTNNMESIDKYRIYPERAKRSLKIFHRPLKLLHFKRKKHAKGHKLHDNDKTNNNNKNVDENGKAIAETKESNKKPKRNKRFDNTSEPEGFIIENKKVMIKYKPNRKSKCSHAPKESKSHETQLKHPFYQNTQRLDELLDRFLGKNLPELLDPFGLDLAIDKEKKCKHPKLKVDTEVTVPDNVIENEKTITKVDEKFSNLKVFNKDKENTKMTKAETNTELFAELEFSDGIKRETATNTYGLLMSVSTVIYPENNSNLKKTSYYPMLDRVPNARKLLQTDADDDMNEVIVDAHDSVDANDDPEDRKKRMGDSNMALPSDNSKKNPASIINPNWKGAMPLYPDELNSMVKQDTRINRVETPVHNSYNTELNEGPMVNSEGKYDDNQNLVETPLNKDTLSETDESDADLNDMDYIEDYFRNKYDRLVEMAQAYSDYGVLEGKKSTDKVDDKAKSEVSDRRVKLSLGGLKEGFKNSIFGRSKKGSNQDPSVGQNTPASEGFRLEFQPNSETREDNPTDFFKSLQKHLKFSNPKANQYDTVHSVPELELMYTPKVIAKSTKKCERGVLFSLGKRTLKSVDIEEPESDKSEPITDFTIRNIDEIETDTTVDVDDNTKNEFENLHLRLKRKVGSSALTKDATMKAKLHTEVQTETYSISLSDIDKEIIHNFNHSEVLKHEVSNNSLSTDKIPIDEFLKDKDDKKTRLNLTDESSYKTDNMSLSNFFMLLSNWFSALDGVDINSNQSLNENTSAINKMKEVTNNSEITYPIYDSDMIENIGHRSRVLLSLDVNATAKEREAVGNTEKPVNITKDLLKTTTTNQTKSIVKRDIDDSNLIFWNDIYDDEYGVIDNSENVREKYSVKSDTKKPNDWFRDKVRKIADGFHKKAESLIGDRIDVKKGKEKVAKVAEDGVKIKQKSTLNRFSRNADETAGKTDFAALTENMKKICKKAAKDVALANKIDVRQVNKEGQATSTLMQQLVRMMADLVDYQVKQRTCRKLPPDLQNFLEWLTSGTDGEPDKDRSGFKTDDLSDMDFEKLNVKPGEGHTSDMIPMDRGDKPASRDYLGTLQAVQALMKQYEEMSDDDKSKMTGVKEYLENQIQFLQKQINAGIDINLYNTDPVRFRRDVSNTLKDKPKRRRRFKQLFAKLMKKLGRKRNDKNEKPSYINDKIINNKDIKEKIDKENVSKKVEKRNLRDVYYKAIEDAKKQTTIKSN